MELKINLNKCSNNVRQIRERNMNDVRLWSSGYDRGFPTLFAGKKPDKKEGKSL